MQLVRSVGGDEDFAEVECKNRGKNNTTMHVHSHSGEYRLLLFLVLSASPSMRSNPGTETVRAFLILGVAESS